MTEKICHNEEKDYVKDLFCCTEPVNSSNNTAEVLGINMENRNLVLIIVCIYKSISAMSEEFKDQIRQIDSCLESPENKTKKIILLGLFNFPNMK